MKRATISPRTRWNVLYRCEFKCAYCGHGSDRVRLTLDHVVPHSKGGSDEEDNLVAACEDCNGGKSNIPGPGIRKGYTTAVEDCMLAILSRTSVRISDCKGMLELNTLRRLSQKGLVTFTGGAYRLVDGVVL